MIEVKNNQTKIPDNHLFQQLYSLQQETICTSKGIHNTNNGSESLKNSGSNHQSNNQQKQKQGVSPVDKKSTFKPSDITKYLLTKIQQTKQQPWNLLNNIPQLIKQYMSERNEGYMRPIERVLDPVHFKVQGIPHFKNPQEIYIGQNTIIQHGVYICGPCIIGNNCELRKGAYIRGNAIIADGTLLGNSCQVKNVLFMDHCQIAHFNYVGDSILGIKAHLSAGAITSNYKLDGSLIKLTINKDTVSNKEDNAKDNQKQQGKQISKANQIKADQGEKKKKGKSQSQVFQTGRNKLGALLGHNVQVGCNAILNPGSIIGKNSVIYPLVSWRGHLAKDRICKISQSHHIVERR